MKSISRITSINARPFIISYILYSLTFRWFTAPFEPHRGHRCFFFIFVKFLNDVYINIIYWNTLWRQSRLTSALHSNDGYLWHCINPYFVG